MKKFTALDTYKIARGTVYCGPSPIDFERDKWVEAFAGPWEIEGQAFCVVGVESNCLTSISKGSIIGLLVKPWPASQPKGDM